MGTDPTGLRPIDVQLQRRFRTPRRNVWIVQQVVQIGVAAAAVPLVSRIGLILPGVPGWVGVLALVGAMLVWFTHRFPSSSRDLQDIVMLIRAGELEAAQPRLERALARASVPLAAQFSMMLGTIEIEMGRTEYGLALLESARTSGWFDHGLQRPSRGVLYACMASGYADLGDDEAAAHALALAKREIPPTHRGLALADDVHVLARAGRHADVHDCVVADLDAAEQLLPAWAIKWIRVVHAYSRAAAGSDYRSEAGEDVRALLADPRVRRSVVRLGARWPEFRAFLVANGVTADDG